nr:hypothetical protein [uncultured Carboxylicivirga sp.]
MDRFLKAKHWQIFTLLIGIPFLIQVTTAITTITQHSLDITLFLMPVMTFLYIGVLFGWFWAIGTKLHERLPENTKVNLKLFKLFWAVPIVYFLVISFYMLTVASGLIESNRPPAFAMFDIIDKVFPLHILSMFCILYVMWINAKTIKSVEIQRPIKFVDYVGDFFLLWFFPIGIWIIQPRINKLAENNKAHTANKPQ